MRSVLCMFAWSIVGAAASGQVPGNDPNYIVAGSVDGAPAECSATAVADRASKFFAAMNAGDSDVESRFFGRRPTAPFQWFTFSDRETGLSYSAIGSPDGLTAHFAKRHAAGNRWVLRGIEFNGWVPERNSVGFLIFFEYYVRNQASGEEIRRLAFGKGEFHCPTSTFVVMSLGLQDQPMWDRLFRTHVLSRRIAG